MSRYYDVQLFSPGSKELIRRWTSHPNGLPSSSWPDMAAQDIEMDLIIYDYAVPEMNSFVRIYGPSFEDLRQAQNWNPNPSGKFSSPVGTAAPQGANPAAGPTQPRPAVATNVGASIAIYGGMGKGLPLANPAQSGLLVAGTVNEAFGNWVGTDVTLDLYVTAANVTGNQSANLSFKWPKNTPLADLIKKTLNQAFPGYETKINIDPGLVLPNDEAGFYGSLVSFAKYVQEISKHIKSTDKTYRGVRLWMGPNNTFIVDDGTSKTDSKKVEFVDLIGQPTWLDTQNVNFTCVMRADIQVGDYIELPQTIQGSAQGSISSSRNQLAFQGKFQVANVRTIGRFRNPNGASWATVFTAHIP